MEIDPESGENREVIQFNLEDIMSDSKNQVLDLTDIIEADALTAEKGVEGKSILVNIYNSNCFVSHCGWFTVVYRTSHLRNCYYQYRVTIIHHMVIRMYPYGATITQDTILGEWLEERHTILDTVEKKHTLRNVTGSILHFTNDSVIT